MRPRALQSTPGEVWQETALTPAKRIVSFRTLLAGPGLARAHAQAQIRCFQNYVHLFLCVTTYISKNGAFRHELHARGSRLKYETRDYESHLPLA